MATGTKILNGLKIVMTLRRMRKNRAPSDPMRIFEVPVRLRASIG
jgi:hypothetical protein